LVNDTTVCQYSNVVLSATGTNVTWYTTPGGTGIGGTLVTPTDATGEFTFYATQTVNGCEGPTATVQVNVLAFPVVELGTDQVLCEGESLVIGPGDNVFSYTWMDESTATPREVETSNTYVINAANQCGSVTDAINVQFNKCDCFFYVPNAFTPDVDGLNDAFKPIYDCSIKNYVFMVFNRWGELIFKSEDPDTGWNGTHRNIVSKEDVYVYKVKFTAVKGTVEEVQEYNGRVALLR
ncbi:MAG TPA: gliding motility-associated C-terminal domain-containing protein, partial [Flavobacteriales bacterium]|nr:gliding motility-associated C-terminal domain-containing protein [Flavobacteriales bacterium]